MTVRTMSAEQIIAIGQIGAHTHGNRFLPNIEVQRRRDETLHVKFIDAFFKTADQYQLVQHLQMVVFLKFVFIHKSVPVLYKFYVIKRYKERKGGLLLPNPALLRS